MSEAQNDAYPSAFIRLSTKTMVAIQRNVISKRNAIPKRIHMRWVLFDIVTLEFKTPVRSNCVSRLH